MLVVVLIIIVIIYIICRNRRSENFRRTGTLKAPRAPRPTNRRRDIKPELGDTALGGGGQGKTFVTKDRHVRKLYYSTKGYENNVKALKLLSSQSHIPRMISHNPEKLEVIMEHCGSALTKENCPNDIEYQIAQINNSLQKADIYNTDATNRSNYTVKDNTLYLIDWGFISEGYRPIDSKRIVDRLHPSRASQNHRVRRYRRPPRNYRRP